MSKRRKRNEYFTKETQDAIVEYNSTDCPIKRNKIYTEKIHPAFYKIAEILIHRYKFYSFDYPVEDVKNEVISFLVEKIHRFDEDLGYKAFSFFSIIAKHYLIAENTKHHRKGKQKESVDIIDDNRDVIGEEMRKNFLENTADFMNIFSSLMEKNLDGLFKKPMENAIAEEVIMTFKNRDSLETFNKKMMYFMIREKTNASAKQITDVVKTIKKIYSSLYLEYENDVDISKFTADDINDVLGGM